MRSGYLSVETHPQHPGLVRLIESETAPAFPVAPDGGVVLYVASFKDVVTGHMHAHETLHTHLVDVDKGLYRVDPITAIAAIEAEGLIHQRVWIDSELGGAWLQQVERKTGQFQQRDKRHQRYWQWVGWIALGWLVLTMLVLY